MFPGRHECVFVIDKASAVELGIVPTKSTSEDQEGLKFGWMLNSSSGVLYKAPDSRVDGFEGEKFKTRDSIAVSMDLDSNKLSFKKNGKDMGTRQTIEHQSYTSHLIPSGMVTPRPSRG